MIRKKREKGEKGEARSLRREGDGQGRARARPGRRRRKDGKAKKTGTGRSLDKGRGFGPTLQGRSMHAPFQFHPRKLTATYTGYPAATRECSNLEGTRQSRWVDRRGEASGRDREGEQFPPFRWGKPGEDLVAQLGLASKGWPIRPGHSLVLAVCRAGATSSQCPGQ